MIDLRLTIGLFFVLNAALLIGYGLVSPHETKLLGRSINLNVAWGGMMAIFGALMLALARLKRN